jgi:hypothetical protein
MLIRRECQIMEKEKDIRNMTVFIYRFNLLTLSI